MPHFGVGEQHRDRGMGGNRDRAAKATIANGCFQGQSGACNAAFVWWPVGSDPQHLHREVPSVHWIMSQIMPLGKSPRC